MSTASNERTPRLTAVMRGGERVTPLELFFDLVFVLALTQCTTLIARSPTWIGLLKGVLALGMLWWAWTGYAWLTSVVDPEEGSVRLVIFTAMAAMLVAALCVPGAFGSEALLFACAYAVSGRRLACALVLLGLIPITLALKISSLVTLAILAAVLSLLIVYEVTRYADVRERVRHQGSPRSSTP